MNNSSIRENQAKDPLMKIFGDDPEELKSLKNQLTSQLEGDDVGEKLFNMMKTYCYDISFVPEIEVLDDERWKPKET